MKVMRAIQALIALIPMKSSPAAKSPSVIYF